ncbi:sodium-extruding oxaloacetate decarboxylase subunit alpha [Helicobacter turcicus]|uniref:Sodium-extruding oxaloacetate decarboxylase subunit alpha n=1 Tax=Helicobacter turcicus TaxID=2867412 RepID=A0ABS7JLR0_9HELI|nr:sodium-extruding oxaloacetate decarboxylase subunit alpha [Helicobacter turcicus]MBX7490338.1 sodium-extruding oxaloacetate decarboxylase subunit alpha [Helicobacter turcicus]MBX7545083.1 sodium-extruding oxaloacetate decarboxylase subunit alpha [Helicobacter turcicus]
MIKITENSLRDGHQSLLATRMRIEDLVEAAQLFEQVGFHSVEVWGGATYDTCLRYLKEDPFERLATFKEIFKKTPIQMLLRGQNLIGYRHYADDVVREFVRLSAQNGVDIFRIFDALNDIRNLEVSIEEVKKQGKHAQGAICYTTSPVHTIKSFVEYGKELAQIGCDSLAIKDMAGLITPNTTFELVKALKEEIGLPLALHTHSTAGFAFGSHLKAVEAGVDILDLANSALAEGTSHPCTQSMVATLQNTQWDSKLDLSLMEKAAEILKRNRRKYKKFESEYNQIDTRVLVSQIPGGMISNLANQLREQNALDKMDAVLQEIPNVRKDFGYPPLVTPSSQIVGTQAVLNVLAQTRYKTLTTESKNIIKGYYGKTPAPIDSTLIERIRQEGEEIITGRPADKIAPELQKAKEESQSFAKSETDVISYAIFGGIAKQFLDERNENRLSPEALTTFEGGMQGPMPKEFTINLHGETYRIKIEGSGEKNASMRPFFVRVDGDLREVLVESDSKEYKNSTEKSDSLPQASLPGHIISPMPGNLTKLKVKVGDKIKEGDVLAIVEAMKMENQVLATVGGEIKEIYAKEGQQISANLAIMLVE